MAIETKTDGKLTYYLATCTFGGRCRWGWRRESVRFDPDDSNDDEKKMDAWNNINTEYQHHLDNHQAFNER